MLVTDSQNDMTCSKGSIREKARLRPRFVQFHPSQSEHDGMSHSFSAHQTDFFSPGRPPAAYLASWHQGFAALDASQSQPLELHFDRGVDAPIVERVRIPICPNSHVKHIIAMYLAVLINNVLCTFGAKSVHLATPDVAIGREYLQYIRQSILHVDSCVSDKSFLFIRRLIEQVYGAPLAFEAIRMHDRQIEPTPRPVSASAASPALPGLWPQGSALAVNIGQHLTGFALVRLGRTGYQLENFSRVPTWPEGECPDFPHLWERILKNLGGTVGNAPQAIDAVAVSIAATVARGNILPVAEFGLFAQSAPEELAQTNALLVRTCGERFPGCPITITNDAEAQALFAFAVCDEETRSTGGNFLSLRLGACPSIRCLDAQGSPEPGIHEYAWLATKRNTTRIIEGLFTTTSAYLSHYGIGRIAWELGLLEKYSIDPEQAIPFFYNKLLSNKASEVHDAQKIYFVLGAHIAMVAFEVHRHRPLGTVALHGSRTNKIDDLVFEVIRNGFYAFSAKTHLPFEGIDFCCLEDTSAVAGLVGAAMAALRS